MNLMKRPGLSGALVVLGPFLAATALWADKPLLPKVQHYTYTLVPPADSPEPDASGKCTFETHVTLPMSVTVSCRGLMPSQQYWMMIRVMPLPDGPTEEAAYPFTTDARGRFDGEINPGGYTSGLWVENSAGGVLLVVGQLKN